MELSSRNLLAALLVAGLAACNGDKDTTDTDTTDTTDTTDECVAGISETFPDVDETNVFYRTGIEVSFNQEESGDSATLTLADAAGADVAGTTSFSADGRTATFTPSAALAASTQYTLTVAYSCEKTATVSFTTSAVGSEVVADDLLDGVYNIDLGSARITEPAGVGGLLTPLIADADFILMVSPTGINGTDIDMIGAIFEDDGAGGVQQDTCLPTLALDPADFSENPFFELSGEDTIFSILGFTIEVAQLELSGAFSPDGSSIQGVGLDLFIDTEQLNDLDLGLDLGDQSICELVGGFGVNCVDCGDGSVTCLKLVADSIVAELEAGAEITEISDQDIQDAIDAGVCEDPTAG
jgi:hypothetical protein